MEIAYIVTLFIGLVLANELLGRAPRRLAAGAWLLAPAALLPLWLEQARQWEASPIPWTWFLWAKTFSVIAACIWILAGARSRTRGGALGVLCYVLLVGNILEAVAKDLGAGHLLNAGAGFLLAVTTPLWKAVKAEQGPRRLSYEIQPLWILAYTAWNWSFLYGNWSSAVAGQHLAVLAAPLAVAALFGWRFWFAARAFTLGLYLLSYNTAYGWFRTGFETSAWHDASFAALLPVLPLSLVLVHGLGLLAAALEPWRLRTAASSALGAR